ncbi:MAG: HAD-IIB family hydrolase, partial [Firmicutes bacterium]|nr:HAD-IIB family hydrolase [Bacillota bacterium]
GRDLTVHLFLHDRLYVKEIDERVRLFTANARVEAEPVGDLDGFLADGTPPQLLALGEPVLLQALRAELTAAFAGEVELTFSRPHYLEMMAPGVSKAAALLKLAARLGIKREETMAIGDGPNDLAMLLAAGIGVAVGNAPAEILARAPYITAPCDRDGVAEAIRRFAIG